MWCILFLTIVDDYSKYLWIYLFKIEVQNVFLNFVAMVDRQFNHTIKRVSSNNGA